MNINAFGAQLHTLEQIFDSRFFTIPDYQRGYAWDEKQVNELLNDIDHLLYEPNSLRHYSGTLVFTNYNTHKRNNEYYIVDGQQRLTTLVILLTIISRQLNTASSNIIKSKYIKRGKQGNIKHVLRLNSDNRRFFEDIIIGSNSVKNNPATLMAHERLLKARSVIEAWLVNKLKNSFAISDILNTIEHRLAFLIYAPENSNEIGVMFEVINNRGKPLSDLEKVKNYLLYCSAKLSAESLREKINEDWSHILENLNAAKSTSTTDEGSFLRYCVAVCLKLSKEESQYGYDNLKHIINIDHVLKRDDKENAKEEAIWKIEKFIDFVRSASLWYARLFGQKHDGLDKSLANTLDIIRAQDRHASIMPLFLSIMIKEGTKTKNRVRLLQLLEILNFRVYMSRGISSRNDTGQADLFHYSSLYFHGCLLKNYAETLWKIGREVIDNDDSALEYSLVEFTYWRASDSLFSESFSLPSDSPYDFYEWGGLRYFLMNYEAALQPNKTIAIDKITKNRSEVKTGDYLSVEHIWALENRNREGENDRKIDKFEKRRLGNFVLLELRLNIQGRKEGIEEKVPRYLSGVNGEPPTDLEQVRIMGKAAKRALKRQNNLMRKKNYYLTLSKTLNDEQEERFIKFAESRWSLEGYIGYQEIIQQAEEESAEDE